MNKQLYDTLQDIKEKSPTIIITENYGTTLVNELYVGNKEYYLDIDNFFLACLKNWIIQNSFADDYNTDSLEYIGRIDKKIQTVIDFQKISDGRFNYFIHDIKSIDIDYSSVVHYVSYINSTYQEFGVLETKSYFYCFIRILG